MRRVQAPAITVSAHLVCGWTGRAPGERGGKQPFLGVFNTTFNGYLVRHSEGNLCVDPVPPSDEALVPKAGRSFNSAFRAEVEACAVGSFAFLA